MLQTVAGRNWQPATDNRQRTSVHGLLLQVQIILPQPGQPVPYLAAQAASRSTPSTLASVTSQANTSANSWAFSCGVPSRTAPASSPTSSISQMKVAALPRLRSLSLYISLINSWNSRMVIAVKPFHAGYRSTPGMRHPSCQSFSTVRFANHSAAYQPAAAVSCSVSTATHYAASCFLLPFGAYDKVTAGGRPEVQSSGSALRYAGDGCARGISRKQPARV